MQRCNVEGKLQEVNGNLTADDSPFPFALHVSSVAVLLVSQHNVSVT